MTRFAAFALPLAGKFGIAGLELDASGAGFTFDWHRLPHPPEAGCCRPPASAGTPGSWCWRVGCFKCAHGVTSRLL